MQLYPQDIDEYKENYRRHFYKDLADKEDREQARNLIHLFELIGGPLPDSVKSVKYVHLSHPVNYVYFSGKVRSILCPVDELVTHNRASIAFNTIQNG